MNTCKQTEIHSTPDVLHRHSFPLFQEVIINTGKKSLISIMGVYCLLLANNIKQYLFGFLDLEEETYSLSRNDGIELPILAAY